jgi:hypothetical protein
MVVVMELRVGAEQRINNKLFPIFFLAITNHNCLLGICKYGRVLVGKAFQSPPQMALPALSLLPATYDSVRSHYTPWLYGRPVLSELYCH